MPEPIWGLTNIVHVLCIWRSRLYVSVAQAAGYGDASLCVTVHFGSIITIWKKSCEIISPNVFQAKESRLSCSGRKSALYTEASSQTVYLYFSILLAFVSILKWLLSTVFLAEEWESYAPDSGYHCVRNSVWGLCKWIDCTTSWRVALFSVISRNVKANPDQGLHAAPLHVKAQQFIQQGQRHIKGIPRQETRHSRSSAIWLPYWECNTHTHTQIQTHFFCPLLHSFP